MNRINILYCIEYLYSGGTEKQLISLVKGLNTDRFQPHLCCLRSSLIGQLRRKHALYLFQKIECPKIQLNFISFKNIQSLIELVKLIKFIKKHKIAILQTYFQDPSTLGLLAAKLSGVKNVITCFRDMGFWRKQENDCNMKKVYKSCSAYIANSLAVKELYKNVYGLPDDKFTVIYNGIDVEGFRPKTENKDHASKDIIVGIVATLNRKVKRVDLFLKAAAYILQRIESVKFIIAGDGELRKDLVSLSRELGISRNVEFLGRVENIPQLLSTIDIGVVSSDSEGFSNAVLEYMAAGVSVVATDVGGNMEIIANGINGFLVPRGDYRSLGERIIQLATEKQMFDRIRENALEKVRRNYSVKHSVEMYENFYKQLLA